MENKTTIQILAGVIIVMAIVILYFLVIKPGIDKSATNNQVIGYNLAINDILTQIQQQGYVQIPVGNQTLILVLYNPNSQENLSSE